MANISSSSKGDNLQNNNSVDDFLSNREGNPNTQSSIERLKVLDKDFALQVQSEEERYLQDVNKQLLSLHRDMESVRKALISKLESGEKISIVSLTTMLDSLRRWSGSIFQQASLLAGRPTSISGHLNLGLCPKCQKTKSMTDAELDAEINRLQRSIKSRGAAYTPEGGIHDR